jgi:hypothetical protein
MKLSTCEVKIMNSFGDFFFKILKNSNFKNMLNDLEMENLWKFVFRHIKLKLLTKASISCLSHPSMSITTLFMSVFTIACLRKITHFFTLHRAISKKLQHIKLWKFAVFHTSRGTSSLPRMNKIRDGMVFSLVHLTWSDPRASRPVDILGGGTTLHFRNKFTFH